MNRERVKAVARVLGEISLDDYERMVSNDPQFHAAIRLAETLGEHSVAAMVANALVSYRLPLKGEEYWLEYARFVSERRPETLEKLLEALAEFLRVVNTPLLQHKLSRLRRFRNILEELWDNPLAYRSLEHLYARLTQVQRGYSKTVVFAAKMAWYAYRSLGYSVEGIEGIPMPVDRRIAIVTYTSGMLDEKPELILRRPSNAVKAWSLVSSISGVPCLYIDTLVWLVARDASLPELDLHALLRRARGIVGDSVARKLVEELFWRYSRVSASRSSR